jgi:hypothetical protein
MVGCLRLACFRIGVFQDMSAAAVEMSAALIIGSVFRQSIEQNLNTF